MAPQDDLTAERAAIALLEQMGLYGHPAASQFIGDILAALKTARQEALRDAASKLGIGDSSGLLDAPCLWCGYNGRGYYQVGTHDKSCIWHTVGGRNERLDRLASEGV